MTAREDGFARAARIVAHDAHRDDLAAVPPIVPSSLFTFASVAEMVETFAGRRARPVYSRVGNPTVRAFEETLAALEGARDALALASGMAAISSAVLSVVSPGDRIVCVRHVYPDAYRLFETLLRRLGVAAAYVDPADEAALAEALPGARLLYLESPSSWMMEACDLGRLAALARAHGVVTICDNSWATPVHQRPLDLGCDLVVHSASKYLGGHSDVVAGVVAGSREHVDRVRREILPYLGAKLSAQEAWLLLRGLRTLPLRMREHEAAAREVARRLAAHPAVERVRQPGLDAPLPSGLTGVSGLLSIELGPATDVARFCDALRMFRLGVSWGGHESLVVPALVTHAQDASPNPSRAFGVPERMVRLHVGLEGAGVLWDDLAAALDHATTREETHETHPDERGAGRDGRHGPEHRGGRADAGAGRGHHEPAAD